jgi:hypothetical protein
MSTSNASARSIQREVLPIPDIPPSGLVTYDAQDPGTSFAPIEELSWSGPATASPSTSSTART